MRSIKHVTCSSIELKSTLSSSSASRIPHSPFLRDAGNILRVLSAQAEVPNAFRQMADSSQYSWTRWWGCASVEPKSIYKCNLTVTLHKAWRTAGHPTCQEPPVNRSNPVSAWKGPLKTQGCTWAMLAISHAEAARPLLYNGWLAHRLPGSRGARPSDVTQHEKSLQESGGHERRFIFILKEALEINDINCCSFTLNAFTLTFILYIDSDSTNMHLQNKTSDIFRILVSGWVCRSW